MGCFLRGAWRKLRNKSKRRSKETLRPTSSERVDEASTKCTGSNKDAAPVALAPTLATAPGLPRTSEPPVAPSVETTTDISTGGSASKSSVQLAQQAPIRDHRDIWHKAYTKFAERERDLADDYRKVLAADSPFLTPDEAKAVVGRLQEERQAKQWKFTFYGKDVNFRAQVERMAKALVWCDSVVKDALSAQPYAALAWSGVSICLPLLTNASAQNATMISGFDSIQRVIVYWKIYQDAFPEDFNAEKKSDSHNDLVNLYSHIFEFQARVICHLSSPQLSRAWQNVAGWNDWETKASHIDNLSDECKKCTDISRALEAQEKCDQQLREMFESRKVLQKIHQVMVEANQQRLDDRDYYLERDLLKDLATNHETYKNFNPTKVEGTCGWILEDPGFGSWRNRTDSGLLFLFAGPGCGKSVLTRSLIDDWQLTTSATTSMVCHFFFKDGDAKRIHSHDALASILHQILIQDLTGKFLTPALRRHKKYGEKLAQNFDELWSLLLDCAFTPDAGEIVCVLDAFDECLQDERGQLMAKLEEFFSTNGAASQHNCRLKFFITSRPYDTIERPLQSLLNTSCLQIDGDNHSAAIREDINRVIDERIPKLLVQLSEEEKKLVCSQLKEMRNRTYLWLRLTFVIIKNDPFLFSRHKDVEDRLIQKLPESHTEAYETILNQKCNDTFTRPLLEIILASKRPLSLDEANIALAAAVKGPADSIEPWPKDSFEGCVKNFGGLLLDTHDSQVQFIHQTVREYLTDDLPGGKEWRWGRSFSPSKYHKTMTHSCIHYLSSPDPNASVGQSSDFHNAFFRYAAKNWTLHFRECGDDIDTELLRKAVDLCHANERNSSWLQSHLYEKKYEWLSPEWSSPEWLDWSDLRIASWFGLDMVVRAIIEKSDVHTNAVDGQHGAALNAASWQGFVSVVNILIDNQADVNARWNGRSPVFTASAKRHYPVARLLLDRCFDEIEITMTDLIQAAYRFTQREAESLLEKMVDKVMLTPENLAEACASPRAYAVLALIFKYRGEEVNLTPSAIAAAASNENAGLRTMGVLFENKGFLIKITPECISAAKKNKEEGKWILELIQLFRQEGKDRGLVLQEIAERVTLIHRQASLSVPLSSRIENEFNKRLRTGLVWDENF